MESYGKLLKLLQIAQHILKRLSLLKVQNMYELKILKFLYKLYANDFPMYFDVYRPHLNKIETPFPLRPHPLPVSQVALVYAETSVVYKLVSTKIFRLSNNMLLVY